MSDVHALLQLCQGHHVFIQTHNFPDPDAISSAYGLQKLLAEFHIQSTLCYQGQIDKISSIKLLEKCEIDIFDYDTIKDRMTEDTKIILVDCQKQNGNTDDFIGDEIAAIDHHPTVTPMEYEYSDLRITGACASIITDYYIRLGLNPAPLVATALLYGLRMDTLQFSRGVTQLDIDAYSFLFSFAKDRTLRKLENNNLEFADLAAYSTAIQNIRGYGRIGITYIDSQCPDALVATISDFILSLVEVEVAIVFANRKNGYKFSVRSERKDVHAGNLLHDVLLDYGSGGGHASMAGGFVLREKVDEPGVDILDTMQNLFNTVLERDYPNALESRHGFAVQTSFS